MYRGEYVRLAWINACANANFWLGVNSYCSGLHCWAFLAYHNSWQTLEKV